MRCVLRVVSLTFLSFSFYAFVFSSFCVSYAPNVIFFLPSSLLLLPFLPSFFLILHSSLRSVTLGFAPGGNQAFSFHSWHQIRPTRTTQGCNTWCKRMHPNPLPYRNFQFNSDFVGRRRPGLGRACAPDRMAYSYKNPCVWALQCPRCQVVGVSGG